MLKTRNDAGEAFDTIEPKPEFKYRLANAFQNIPNLLSKTQPYEQKNLCQEHLIPDWISNGFTLDILFTQKT